MSGNKHVKWYVILAIALTVSLAWGVKKNTEAKAYANEIKMDYQRCFTELVQYVDDLETSLEKSLFVNDAEQMMRLSGEIYRQASQASANLAMLPLRKEPFEHIGEFLNQVGNYSYALSAKMLDGEKVSGNEYENLSNLSKYADILAKNLDEDLESLYNGTLDIRRAAEDSTASGIDKAIGEIEDQLHDYPALIYDGPFSSHLTDKKSVYTQGKSEISENEAIEKAKAITGLGSLVAVFENGNIPTYYVSDKKSPVSIGFTKEGGHLLYYLNDRVVGDAKYTMGDAKIAALSFLESQGFKDMRENYYETHSNVAVINYAPVQEGYTLYPDLIKVKVALDNCEIIGCETRGYVMYHTKRDIPQIKVTAEEAKQKINPNVEFLSISLAVIPSESGKESFCWQIEGKVNDRRCLIYVNTQTGAEEKIFLLIESETGVLAV